MTAERCTSLADRLEANLSDPSVCTEEEVRINKDIVSALREYAGVISGKTVDADSYQRKARSFAVGGGSTLMYAIFGMIEEVGELLEKIDFRKLSEEDEKHDVEANEISAAGMVEGIIMMANVAKVIAKHIRKNWDSMTNEQREAVSTFDLKPGWDGEVGDIMWFAAAIASSLRIKMSEAMTENIGKLESRKSKGIIVGNGDTDEERLRNAGSTQA